MRHILFFVYLIALLVMHEAKKFERCELVKHLIQLGVDKKHLATWICIAAHESNYDTKAVNPTNVDGSKDFGIFQINNRYWCDVVRNHIKIK